MVLVFFSSSCGQKSPPEESMAEEVYAPGFFLIEFTPINPKISGYLTPKGVMWIKEDQLYIKIVMNDGQPNVRYQQYIHSGSQCPSLLNDRSNDGVLDYSENFQASGKVLFPLDKNLKDDLSGNEWFPVANKKGIYTYSQAASLPLLMKKLRDSRQGAGAVLGPREQLDPDNRTIILYGTYGDPLLPVSCGRIKKNRIHPWD